MEESDLSRLIVARSGSTVQERGLEIGPEEEEQEADAVEMVEEPERSDEPKLMLWSSSARSSGMMC